MKLSPNKVIDFFNGVSMPKLISVRHAVQRVQHSVLHKSAQVERQGKAMMAEALRAAKRFVPGVAVKVKTNSVPRTNERTVQFSSHSNDVNTELEFRSLEKAIAPLNARPAPQLSSPMKTENPAPTPSPSDAADIHDEISHLLDQMDQEVNARHPYKATGKYPRTQPVRPHTAREMVNQTTADLTALLEGFKAQISASRTEYTATEAEMLPAEKVSFSAKSFSAVAVTAELDGDPIKQIPIRRPHPLLMAEAESVQLAD